MKVSERTRCSAVLCLAACVALILCWSGMSRASLVITETPVELGDVAGVRYDVTNNTPDSVYSILIGSGPYGSKYSFDPDWSFRRIVISTSDGKIRGTRNSTIVFDNLPADFGAYSDAYLFYESSGDAPGLPIVSGGTGIFVVQTSWLSSPFVYTNSPIDPYDPVPGGYTYDGTGHSSAVPLPSALLLVAPGMAGLALVRRRLRK